jgi:glyoxylase-like metal-dependent hydrolase (beta-lactamase superfamily II)
MSVILNKRTRKNNKETLMKTDRYRFKLGDFECLAILDKLSPNVDTDWWFSNVTPDDLDSVLRAGGIESVNSSIICLAINTGTDWILIDTGLGFVSEDTKLAQILEEENIQPRHIIITHLDLDHYAGLITRDKTPAFPDAQVHICRDAWSLFTSEAFYEDRDTYDRREHLLLIEEQVKLVECAGEVLPGFSMIPLPGHREHHLGIEVSSNGETLLYAADAYVRPLHIEQLDWHFGGDADHEIARETRVKVAQMASESGCLVLGFHFDFPGVGHIIQNGDGWKWQPLEL